MTNQLLVIITIALHCVDAQNLSDPCIIDLVDNCPPNAVCLANECQCKFGHVPAFGSNYDCVPYKCLQDFDCTKKFGSFVSCNSANECVCSDNYAPESTTQKCSKLIGASCSVNWQDCGANAICGNEKCRCRIGYLPAADQVHCDKFQCEMLSCETHFGEHTECQSGLCVCDKSSDIQLDYQSQTCIKSPTTTSTSPAPPTSSTASNENIAAKRNNILRIIGITASILASAICAIVLYCFRYANREQKQKIDNVICQTPVQAVSGQPVNQIPFAPISYHGKSIPQKQPQCPNSQFDAPPPPYQTLFEDKSN